VLRGLGHAIRHVLFEVHQNLPDEAAASFERLDELGNYRYRVSTGLKLAVRRRAAPRGDPRPASQLGERVRAARLGGAPSREPQPCGACGRRLTRLI
jgi:hypothetical protein